MSKSIVRCAWKALHRPQPPAMIKCTQCNRVWCCMECCCEDDSLDHKYFDMIYENEKPYPDQYEIVCCSCSGEKRSWEDRDDE